MREISTLALQLKLWVLRFLEDLSPRRKRLRQLRAAWGRPGEKDAWLVSRYLDVARPADPDAFVDDTTWADLEMPEVFAALDTTVTPLGSQYLYRRLRTYDVHEPDTAARYALYETLRGDRALREEIQLTLTSLAPDSAAWTADAVFGKGPENPKYGPLIYVWSLVSVAALAGVLTAAWGVGVLAGVALVNAAVLLVVTPRLHGDDAGLRSCGALVRTADGLASIRTAVAVPQLAELRDAGPARVRLRRALPPTAKYLSLPLAGSVAIWLNVLCLSGLVLHIRSARRFEGVRADLQRLFDAVASLDAAVAVACFQERLPAHCRAEITDEPIIDIRDGCHPLISRPTGNSLRLDGLSALVTGSNLAGKTTFIKMIGVNVILGRTIGVCLASKAVIPRANVMASIRGEHSVASGKSHYFAQVEAVRSFIETADGGRRSLFLIDEPFSGTNTVERIAAAKAVLQALAAHGQVLVTTHDVELQTLLGDRFVLLHFREDPDADGYFDYRLRQGAATERNALRLLERLGLPAPIVREAMATANAVAEELRGDSTDQI